jgi:hypothetical protein
MRQTISGVVAALAVVAASSAPAMACGFTSCTPCGSPCGQTYAPIYAPTYGHTGCATGCNTGWGFERLAEPTTQYYYVNQGPTYTGPGDFAPVPTYQESAVSGWDAYRTHPHYYGYDGGRYASATSHYYDGAGLEGPAMYSYRWHRHYPWHTYLYGYAPRYHHSMRYSYAPYPYYYGHRVLRRYY